MAHVRFRARAASAGSCGRSGAAAVFALVPEAFEEDVGAFDEANAATQLARQVNGVAASNSSGAGTVPGASARARLLWRASAMRRATTSVP